MGIRKKTITKMVWIAIVAMTILSTVAFMVQMGS
jgi:hypothetical protein